MHIMHKPLDMLASCVVEIGQLGLRDVKNGGDTSPKKSRNEIIICIIFLESPRYLESSLTCLE